MMYLSNESTPISERFFRSIVASAFGVCAIMEFVGYFYYYELWPVYFKVLDILPITIACLYGLMPGLICLIPATISECLWIVSIHAPGPAINLSSFVIINVAVGYLTKNFVFEGEADACKPLGLSELICRQFCRIIRISYIIVMDRQLCLIALSEHFMAVAT